MNHKVSIICIFFVLTSAYCFAFDNEPDGFRGIKWGTDFSTLGDLEYVGTDSSYGGIKMYSRKGDKLTIDGAKVESVEYGFWQDKFFGVQITVRGMVNFSSLRASATEKFGFGNRPNPSGNRYYWSGKITRIALTFSNSRGLGTMFIESTEIHDQQQRYKP
jgi:hypothetical protein